MSSRPDVMSTPISSSPSRSLMAIFPPFLMLSYSLSGVFLISPFFVAIIKFPVASFLTGIIVATFSPRESCKRLIIALPFAWR